MTQKDKATIQEQLGTLPVLTAETAAFTVEPPHQSATRFQRDGDAQIVEQLIPDLTGPYFTQDYPLAERWMDFLVLAQRSPPLFYPVIDGLNKLAIGLGTDLAYAEVDKDARLDIARKLGHHILSLFPILADKDDDDTAIDERTYSTLKSGSHRLGRLIDHQTRFELSRTGATSEIFDSLVLAAQLLPVGDHQDWVIRFLGKMAHDKQNAGWIKPHVAAIGTESDIKYTGLFKFRVETLKRLRSPGEFLLDDLRVIVNKPCSYSYDAPKLPLPLYHPTQAVQTAP